MNSNGDYTMSSNGLFAVLHMPEKLQAVYQNGEEVEHHLPPGAARKAYLVDKYPACPKDWMRSEGKATSYFVPVKEDYGMWLDFNSLQTPYHVAAVVSVQGINAVTGMPVEDVYLEQYIEKCPKHDVKFGPNRFCKKCNYKWPKQNYITTTGTPAGMFWIDGFRAVDGAVRQYVLTQEKMKGVANAILGEKRVFAIGISFFLAKTGQRPTFAPVRGFHQTVLGNLYCSGNVTHAILNESNVTLDSMDFDVQASSAGPWTSYSKPSVSYTTNEATLLSANVKQQVNSGGKIKIKSVSLQSDTIVRPDGDRLENAMASVRSISVKKVEIGAGAKIRQAIYDDPENIDYWRSEPEAIIYINYALEVDVEKILAGGEIDLEGSSEGFLEGIPKSV